MKTRKKQYTHLSAVLLLLCISFSLGSCKEKNKPSEMASTQETPKTAATNWAEKLGWPTGKKVIILHADDIGMCPEANTAAEKLMTNNFIQSSAVMIPCPNAEDFINWAIDNPKMDVGLHLTLTSEWKNYRWGTVTEKSEVPGLLDPTFKMWESTLEVVQHASAEEVEKEIRAQIEQSIAWGYTPDHIDTHMGSLYGDPSYVAVYLKIAQEYGIPGSIFDLSEDKVVQELRAIGYPITDEVIKLVENYSLPKLDYFTSAPKADTYKEKITAFKTLISTLEPGLTEIIFHPSVETQNLKGITYSWKQRVWEAKMFGDPDLINFFKNEGIIFTNWKEIMKKFRNVDK
ncbi:MAG: polysaccharide deacetylase family protein [Flavobacteriaceae bacterium]